LNSFRDHTNNFRLFVLRTLEIARDLVRGIGMNRLFVGAAGVNIASL